MRDVPRFCHPRLPPASCSIAVNGGSIALVTLCIAGGQGIDAIIERV